MIASRIRPVSGEDPLAYIAEVCIRRLRAHIATAGLPMLIHAARQRSVGEFQRGHAGHDEADTQ